MVALPSQRENEDAVRRLSHVTAVHLMNRHTQVRSACRPAFPVKCSCGREPPRFREEPLSRG